MAYFRKKKKPELPPAAEARAIPSLLLHLQDNTTHPAERVSALLRAREIIDETRRALIQIENDLLKEMGDGLRLDGYKPVIYRKGTRAWSDDKAVVDILTERGHHHTDIYQVRSPYQMDVLTTADHTLQRLLKPYLTYKNPMLRIARQRDWRAGVSVEKLKEYLEANALRQDDIEQHEAAQYASFLGDVE